MKVELAVLAVPSVPPEVVRSEAMQAGAIVPKNGSSAEAEIIVAQHVASSVALARMCERSMETTPSSLTNVCLVIGGAAGMALELFHSTMHWHLHCGSRRSKGDRNHSCRAMSAKAAHCCMWYALLALLLALLQEYLWWFLSGDKQLPSGH